MSHYVPYYLANYFIGEIKHYAKESANHTLFGQLNIFVLKIKNRSSSEPYIEVELGAITRCLNNLYPENYGKVMVYQGLVKMSSDLCIDIHNKIKLFFKGKKEINENIINSLSFLAIDKFHNNPSKSITEWKNKAPDNMFKEIIYYLPEKELCHSEKPMRIIAYNYFTPK